MLIRLILLITLIMDEKEKIEGVIVDNPKGINNTIYKIYRNI